MHPTDLPSDVVEGLVRRRGRRHVFNTLDPARTALVVIDMQEMFTQAGAPLEVPLARAIVPMINRAAEGVRALGGHVYWVRSTFPPGAREWRVFFGELHAGERGAAIRAGLENGAPLFELTEGLRPEPGDNFVEKDRFSAFLPGASRLGEELEARGIDTVLIAGTLTNVCCESSARDAMMRNFRVVMLADANATRSDAEHLAALVNVAQSFGDVQNLSETLDYLSRGGPALE